jgi:hypothetical protein
MSSETEGRSTLKAVYNKYLVDLLLQRKPHDPCLKRALQSGGHAAIDPTSDAYISHASRSLPLQSLARDVEPADVLSDEGVLASEPLPGVSVRAIVSSEAPVEVVPYVYVLAVLSAAYADGSDALARNVVAVLSKAQSGEDESSFIDSVLDDDIRMLLRKVAETSASASAAKPEDASAPFAMEQLLSSLKGSKIMDLATEVSKEVDLGALGDQGDALDFQKLADNGSVLSNIIGKVGAKFKEKFDSGEIRQEDLIKEAMSFISAAGAGGAGGLGGAGGAGGFDPSALLNDKNLMRQFMNIASSMQQGAAGPSRTHSTRETRERLREKLAAKQQSQKKQ